MRWFGKRTLLLGLVSVIMALGLAACGDDPTPTPTTAAPTPTAMEGVPTPTSGEAALAALIAQARQEGNSLKVNHSTRIDSVIPEIEKLFNARFGLDKDIQIAVGAERSYNAQLAVSIEAGVTPELSVYAVNNSDLQSLIARNAIRPVENYKELLFEINSDVRDGTISADDISRPHGWESFAFIFYDRVRAFHYNSELISADELPKTHLALGTDPAFDQRYGILPFGGQWELLFYMKEFGVEPYASMSTDELIDILIGVGQQAYAVDRSQGVQRVALGEFAIFVAVYDNHFDIIAANPNAPMEVAFFEDGNELNHVTMFMPAGGRNPATATLWMMFMTTPEAQVLRATTGTSNVAYGQTALDDGVRETMAGFTFWEYDSIPAGRALAEFFGTPEGEVISGRVEDAIRGR